MQLFIRVVNATSSRSAFQNFIFLLHPLNETHHHMQVRPSPIDVLINPDFKGYIFPNITTHISCICEFDGE